MGGPTKKDYSSWGSIVVPSFKETTIRGLGVQWVSDIGFTRQGFRVQGLGVSGV